jgi:hypothetical protein
MSVGVLFRVLRVIMTAIFPSLSREGLGVGDRPSGRFLAAQPRTHPQPLPWQGGE